MKTPMDPTDPLLQSLAEETANLPLMAAVEARKHRALRARRRQQTAITLAVLLSGACGWQIFSWKEANRGSLANRLPPIAPVAGPTQSTPPAPHPREYFIARTEQQAKNDPLPIPAGLSKEQRAVVESARGLPLLLVYDDSGKVARINLFER